MGVGAVGDVRRAVAAAVGGGRGTRRSTRLLTLFGPASVERWHWTCGVCGSRTCPLDAGLGAETGGERLTSVLRSVLGWSAAYVSFRGAAEAVRRVAGVSVDAKRLKRSAKALGEALSEQRIDLPQHAQPFERRQIVGLVARSIRMSEGAATEQPPRRARPPQCSRVGCSSHRRYHPILCGEPTDSLCRRPKSLRNGRKKSLRLVHRRPQRGSCVSHSIKQRAPRSNLTTTEEEQRCST